MLKSNRFILGNHQVHRFVFQELGIFFSGTSIKNDTGRTSNRFHATHASDIAQWHLFIGDLTALPAIAATVEQLPDDAVGKAFIQVPLEEDKQAFKTPKNIEVEWIINPYNGQNLLIESLKKMPWPTLKPAIFLAAEAAQVKDIKSYLYEHENFDKRLLYSSAYWNVKK